MIMHVQNGSVEKLVFLVERVSLPDHSVNCAITGSVYSPLDTIVCSR